jgi:lysozyme
MSEKYCNAIKQLKLDEGKRLSLYTCTAGKLTIGYGWNIEDNGLPESIINQLFEISFETASKDALSFVGDPAIWELMGEARQGVIINMAFNLGLTTLNEFKQLRKALLVADWHLASVEMMDSMWSRQVGERAERLAEIMYLGVEK